MKPKLEPLRNRDHDVERFLNYVAERLDDGPRQMILVVRDRDGFVRYKTMNPTDNTLELVATLEWVKLNMFEDFAETQERKV